jgi:hypothetical protein
LTSIRRPFGIEVISVLAIVEGVLLIFGGLSLLAIGVFFPSVPFETIMTEQQRELQLQGIENTAELKTLIQFLNSVSFIIGGIVLAVGIGYLVVSYGLLKGKGWAWAVTVILSIIAIIIQIVSIMTTSIVIFTNDINTSSAGIISRIIGIAINVFILYYLYRPNVKAYFDKSQPSSAIQR